MYQLAPENHFLAFDTDGETVLYRRQDKQTILVSGDLHSLYKHIENLPNGQVFDVTDFENELIELDSNQLKQNFFKLVALQVVLPTP